MSVQARKLAFTIQDKNRSETDVHQHSGIQQRQLSMPAEWRGQSIGVATYHQPDLQQP